MENKYMESSADNTVMNNENLGYRITMFSDNGDMFKLWIPDTAEGSYSFTSEYEYRYFRVEAKDGKWFICCKSPACFKNISADMYREVPVKDELLVKAECEELNCFIFAEKLSRKHTQRHKAAEYIPFTGRKL